jgi:hypothetical protein
MVLEVPQTIGAVLSALLVGVESSVSSIAE